MEQTQPEIRMLIGVEENHSDHLRIHGRPVFVTDDGKIRNITAETCQPHPLADFEVSALADHSTTLGDTYGWHRDYRDVFAIDTVRAEVMVKHLRKLDRQMLQMEQKLGFAETFPQHLARVAVVLGIDKFGRKVESGGSSWCYDGNEYEWKDGTYLASWIASALTDYREGTKR